ncbi:hypothetical protein EYC80_004112 [Monilinia laxa]|uniref:Uncharacterized protein n=1 Tax=Monilinia laxa TaxID=61186 RepID=A0A5N6KMB2_MONLA|nr:hypothetical protein EYC80_004112 [Monilinia laxa]
MTKTLMEKRQKWIKNIGAVFDDERNLGKVPRARDEGSSIFKPEFCSYSVKERGPGTAAGFLRIMICLQIHPPDCG